MKTILRRLSEFRDARDWRQFHTPKNLILALMGEVGELAELYRWGDPPSTDDVEEEVADCLIMLFNLCNSLDIDPWSAVHSKIDENSKRYTIAKSKGRGDKL